VVAGEAVSGFRIDRCSIAAHTRNLTGALERIEIEDR
jgi:hypothetical protein